MKYIIIALTFIIFSCDKRKDYYSTTNKASTVSLAVTNPSTSFSTTIDGNNITDTMKLGQKYTFSLGVTDEATNVDLVFQGDGSIKMDGTAFTTTSVLRNDNHLFEYDPNSVGDKYFTLTFKDVFGVETIYNFHIVVFLNRIPTIDWALFNTNLLSPLDKTIVVTGQDGDYIYGGNIVYYQYVIGADTTLTESNELHYVFPSVGNYLISVKCKDSNSEWSNEITVGNYVIQ